jgi:hypothetical protein
MRECKIKEKSFDAHLAVKVRSRSGQIMGYVGWPGELNGQ